MESETFGQLLALASACSFSGSNLAISRTTASGGDKGVMFSVLVTLGFSGVLWWIAGSGAGIFQSLSGQEVTGILWFAIAGISAMVFGRSLLYQSVRRLGVLRASAVKRLNPFFSVLLAALILHETITGPDMAGIVLIAIGFGLLIYERMSQAGPVAQATTGAGGGPAAVATRLPAAAYVVGVLAALSYAFAYVTRKIGLGYLPDPALGTFISAATGLVVFCLLGLFSSRHRSNLAGIFRHLDRWIVLSAVLVSSGQILLFAALAYESVSTVVMIASLEVFVSMFLSVVVFRLELRPGLPVILSAVFATMGVVLVARG